MENKRCVDEDLPLPRHLLLLLHKEGCLIQILLWLPVVSLLRCKSVCKSWRDLIQSSFFIDLHTTHTFNSSSSSSSSKFGPFILHVSYDAFEYAPLMFSSQSESESVSISGGWAGTGSRDDDDDLEIMDTCIQQPKSSYIPHHALLMLSSQSDSESESVFISGGWSSGGSHDDQELVVVVDDLGCIMSSREEIVIIGSCNGLVCLHDKVLSRGSKPDELSLLNPATEEYRLLPESITIGRRRYTCNLAVFGFDVETKDYKVVQFTGLKPRWNENGNGPACCFCHVQVYSLNTDSWRLLEGIPCLPGYPFEYTDNALYLNGTCFLLAHFFYTDRYPCLPENDRFIISFDFTKEIITPIQLPEHDRNQELRLCSLADKIALFISPRILKFVIHSIDICQDFNIWVLNYENGSSVNKKSWTKLYSFQIQLKSGSDWYKPIGISNDAKFALLASAFGRIRKVKLYNLLTNEVKRDFLSCGFVRSKAHAYKPSLVSVFGGNGAGSSSR